MDGYCSVYWVLSQHHLDNMENMGNSTSNTMEESMNTMVNKRSSQFSNTKVNMEK